MASTDSKNKKPQRNEGKPTAGDSLWDNTKQLVIAVVLALLIKTSVVEAYKIPTASMEDTLLIGDFLLANKFVYGARLPLVNWRVPAIHPPQRGDVVIFIWPGSEGSWDSQRGVFNRSSVIIGDGTKYIKRCVGIPGDTIMVRDKQLYVNGQIFPNPPHSKFGDTLLNGQQVILSRGPGGQFNKDNFGPIVVPEGEYFMMGDNRDNSYDSRFWGPVPLENVLGEAMMVHWSWDDSKHPSPDVTLRDPLSVPRLFLFNAGHFLEKVRWSRLFGIIH
jgi:signal peptidase I